MVAAGGTESSHMHERWDENYQRGYEWWLMTEAKKVFQTLFTIIVSQLVRYSIWDVISKACLTFCILTKVRMWQISSAMCSVCYTIHMAQYNVHHSQLCIDLRVAAVQKCDPTWGQKDPKSTTVDLITFDLTWPHLTVACDLSRLQTTSEAWQWMKCMPLSKILRDKWSTWTKKMMYRSVIKYWQLLQLLISAKQVFIVD